MADNEPWIPHPDKYAAISENISDNCLHWYMTSHARGDRDETILQYCNLKHVKQMFLSNENVLRSLDPNKRHINVGTGAGFMEYTNKKYLPSYKLDTVDLAQGTIDPIFQLCKGILNVEQDHIMKMMRSSDADDFTITNLDPFNNFTRWDNAIFNRFIPMRENLKTKENVKTFNKNMKKYVDRITIVTVFGKEHYPDEDIFPDATITEIGTTLPDHSKTSVRTLIEYDI